MIPQSVYFLILIELIGIAYLDIKYQRISNLWSIANLILWGVVLFIFPHVYDFSLKSFIYPLAIFGLGFILFLANIAGGGDSKILTSLFFLLPVNLHQSFLELVLATTIGFGFLFLVYQLIKKRTLVMSSLKNKKYKQALRDIRSRFSYAPVLLVAWGILAWKEKII